MIIRHFSGASVIYWFQLFLTCWYAYLSIKFKKKKEMEGDKSVWVWDNFYGLISWELQWGYFGKWFHLILLDIPRHFNISHSVVSRQSYFACRKCTMSSTCCPWDSEEVSDKVHVRYMKTASRFIFWRCKDDRLSRFGATVMYFKNCFKKPVHIVWLYSNSILNICISHLQNQR